MIYITARKLKELLSNVPVLDEDMIVWEEEGIIEVWRENTRPKSRFDRYLHATILLGIEEIRLSDEAVEIEPI